MFIFKLNGAEERKSIEKLQRTQFREARENKLPFFVFNSE